MQLEQSSCISWRCFQSFYGHWLMLELYYGKPVASPYHPLNCCVHKKQSAALIATFRLVCVWRFQKNVQHATWASLNSLSLSVSSTLIVISPCFCNDLYPLFFSTCSLSQYAAVAINFNHNCIVSYKHFCNEINSALLAGFMSRFFIFIKATLLNAMDIITTGINVINDIGYHRIYSRHEMKFS